MFSDKVEDIPNENFRDLQTSLSKACSTSARITKDQLIEQSGVEDYQVQIFLNILCEEGHLSAKIDLHCPYCDQEHGIFERKQDLPEDPIHCFCGEEFRPYERTNWTIVYGIKEESDFFPDLKMEFKHFIDSSSNLPPQFFKERFNELQSISPPQKRGRIFDYFVGLLFNQLPNVDVVVGDSVSTGEIDVHVSCLDSPEWLNRLVGAGTVIENKWENGPIETGEVEKFHQKAKRMAVECKMCYFVSVNGFSSGERIGAEQLILDSSDPSIIGIEKEGVEQMIEDATPENILRDRTLR